MLTLPNLITISRLVCVPALVAAAFLDRPSLFIGLLAYALVSDAVDGRLARARAQVTPLGARLDSAADCALYLTAPLAALRLFPDVRAHLTGAVVAVYAGYLVPIAYGAIKYHRLTSYHTVAARVAGVLLSVASFLVLLTGIRWPFYLATSVLLVSAIEEMMITTKLSAWRANVPSIWHLIGILAIASIALPGAAHAQLTQFRLGGNLGYVYDEETDFVYLSAEGRASLAKLPLEFAPRFSYQPASGVSVWQIDLNVLYDLPLAKTSVVMPYAGLGFAFQTITHGGSSAAGYNVIFGAELTRVPVVQPYAQFEYSVLENHFPNQGAIAIGALFRFKN